jgi:isopentenyl-diphosphate delta-isomerase
MTEMVVLCTPDGAAAGVQEKSLVHHDATPLHLAFSCYLFDSGGRTLLTRRAAGKRTWPGVTTNSCCGHPQPGEPMDLAVERRVRQELGLSVNGLKLVLPGFSYRAVMANGVVENELCPVFMATVAAEPAPDPAEVDCVEWVPWADLTAQVLTGERAVSPWCAAQITQLAGLGADPLRWPRADHADLPAAASAYASGKAQL